MSTDTFFTLLAAGFLFIMSLVWLFEAYEKLKSTSDEHIVKGRQALRETKLLFFNGLFVSMFGLYTIPVYITLLVYIVIRTVVRANRLANPRL